MRKIFFFLLFTAFIPLASSAQSNSYIIKGEVKDTANFGYTQFTSISLLRAADSILVSFTRAGEEGEFELKTPKPGKYILLLENIRFASLVKEVNITQSVTNLGVLPLMTRKRLLEEIVISGRQAITVKGDTIEYAADSFATGKYDNVDALLKQLPGLEVGSDGSIKAYGQKVEKMLVDGDEFFSDDPAMVSKMLRASSVDAVQVFDKKTDEAEFTGVDDGTRVKTINLKLKEDAKRGYFGKVSLGGGLSPLYWQNEAMINAFKKKRKITGYAIMSNTNKGGLGFNDSRNFGGGGGFSVSYGGRNISVGTGVSNSSYGGGDGLYSGQGLPETWNAGAHYSNAWKDDNLKINGSYNIARNDFTALNNNITQYILPDTQYFNYSNADQKNSQINNNLSFNGDYKIDSLSSISLRLNGGLTTSSNKSTNHSEARNIDNELVNSNDQAQTNNGNAQNATANLTYHRRFSKKGRSFSAGINGSFRNNLSEGFLNSKYELFSLDSTKTIDQRKVNQNLNKTAGVSLNYTEPLRSGLFLLLNYNMNLNNQESQIQSYNQQPGGNNYDVLDSIYSNHYIYNTLGNRVGARFQYNPKDKISMTVGGDMATTNYTQKDLITDTTFNYNYLNFFPSMRLNYRQSMQSNISFNYDGSSRQPSMQQLQPVRNNDDPLNIAVGNPNLKQSFRHNFALNYFNYKVLSGQNLWVSGNFAFTQNDITQKQNMDFAGRRTYEYVNVNGNYNAGLYANYGRKIYENLRGTVGANASYIRTNNFINNLSNVNNTWSLSPTLNLYYTKDTTLQLYYSFLPTYNNTISEIRTDIRTNYWNYRQTLNATLQLPLRIKLGTNVNWEFRQQLNENDRQNKVFIWNAWVSRSFLKDRSLELKLYANDILNQNVGYNRVETADQISQMTYNTIQRYFLLSLTWNFTKTGSISK